MIHPLFAVAVAARECDAPGCANQTKRTYTDRDSNTQYRGCCLYHAQDAQEAAARLNQPRPFAGRMVRE